MILKLTNILQWFVSNCREFQKFTLCLLSLIMTSGKFVSDCQVVTEWNFLQMSYLAAKRILKEDFSEKFCSSRNHQAE